MNKNDLKDGMIVKLSDGEKLYLLHGLLLSRSANLYISVAKLLDYNDDLTNKFEPSENIIKVFDAKENLLWESDEID